MKKIILSQGLEYNDEYTPEYILPNKIILKLIENKSNLVDYLNSNEIDASSYDKMVEKIDDVSYIIYHDKYDSDSYIEIINKYYYFDYNNIDVNRFRENEELISLLENNPDLCLNSEGHIIFKIVEIPEDLNFEIKRKSARITDINSCLIKKEYLIEVLKNPRIYE